MTPQPHDWDWPEAGEIITHTELTQVCRISAAELDELVEYGALAPMQRQGDQRTFSRACVASLRTATQLRQDYDLDLFTVALLLEHLGRIEELEREVRFLRAHLPAHVAAEHRDGPQPWREPHSGAIAGR
jgi:chaperone modulatory protein CbpM